MQVSLKEEYKGQLGLKYDFVTREFSYILTHHSYPNYLPEIVDIEEGDELIVRDPNDGSILLRRIVEFDYDSHKQMDHETGTFHQMISFQRVKGIMTNIEPTYWFNIFAQGYIADLIKSV